MLLFIVKLNEENMEAILNAIVYDGVAEKSVDVQPNGQTINRYRSVERLIASAGLVRVPCGVCPVIGTCSTKGAIQPTTCTYLEDWAETAGEL